MVTKALSCKHYKGDGYTYELYGGQKLNLCEECEWTLLGEMKKQEVMENKMQKTNNGIILNEIEKLKVTKGVSKR